MRVEHREEVFVELIPAKLMLFINLSAYTASIPIYTLVILWITEHVERCLAATSNITPPSTPSDIK